MTTCRSCEAEIVFVPSAKSGKAMILDAKPSKGVVLVDLLAPGTRKVSADSVARVVDVYTDHHATCPHFEDWR